MNNIVQLNDFRKEILNLVVLEGNTRVGLTLDFLTRIPVKDLKIFHELPIKIFLDFKDVKKGSIDFYINSDQDFINLLTEYKIL